MFGLIEKMFLGLLISIVNASNHTKYLSLSNQKYMIQSTLINLHPNEYNQVSHYYPFVDKLDRCVGSSNTLNDLSNKVCIPNKTEDLNLIVFNMFTGINESKTLKKHISCECKCKFDGTNCNSDQCWNNELLNKELLNPSTCSFKNGKYLASIMDDSAVTCDEVIESYNKEIKTIPINFIKTK